MKSQGRWFVISLSMLLALLIFIFPLISATLYSFRGEGGKGLSLVNYQWIFQQDGFAPALLTSLKLSVIASIINLLLMVPTMVFLNLNGKRFRTVVDFMCILPLVIPVVSLAIGAQVAMPEFLQNTEYELVFFFVIIALPFTYRALDTALISVPLKTLVEASQSLGASWKTTIIRVIAPSIRSGITGAAFLCFALSIGEFTMTSLLHWETFPTWTVVIAQQNILGAIAISVFSFLAAIALLVFIVFATYRRSSRKDISEELYFDSDIRKV